MSGPTTYHETTQRFGFLRLVVEVAPDAVRLRLTPLQRSFRSIPRDEILRAEVASYSPGAYDGWHWGVRSTSRGNRVYRLRGGHGVELTLRDGTQVFVGSERPQELSAAIQRTG